MIRETTSASNLHRRALCLGSARMEAGLSEEDSEYSAEGTLMHAKDADPGASRRGLTREQLDVLERSAALSQVVYAETAKRFELAHDEPFVEGRERAFWLHRGLRKLFPGHCDEWRYYPRAQVLVIIDKKFGYLEVTSAQSNKQLRAYACMGAEEHAIGSGGVVVAITQPRLPFDQRLTMAVYNAEEIGLARAEIFGIWDATLAPDAPIVAGEEQCRYCKAKVTCSAYANMLPPPTVAQQDGRFVAIESITDDGLDYLYRAVWFADKIKDQVHEEIRRRLGAGADLPYTLEENASMRKISDPALARALVVGSGTLEAEEYDACAAPGLGKLEEKVRERWGDKKAEASARLNTLLSGIIQRVEKKPSLKRMARAVPVENPFQLT